jgi:hypothetical protein
VSAAIDGLEPWITRAVLFAPERVRGRLDAIAAAGVVQRVPNTWQIALGVLRMWHRVLFRFDTIGTCRAHAVRNGWRARALVWRPLRFPFLLAERAVAPWDFSGLLSSPERVVCHLLAAHHDENQFLYDLQMLAAEPGRLEALRDQVRAVCDDDGPRGRWLRDLTVYDGYHESLLSAVERAVDGALEAGTAEDHNPDISFFAYLAWCARQPASLAETIAAWREDRFSVAEGMA